MAQLKAAGGDQVAVISHQRRELAAKPINPPTF
jgi:hypothetical protein